MLAKGDLHENAGWVPPSPLLSPCSEGEQIYYHTVNAEIHVGTHGSPLPHHPALTKGVRIARKCLESFRVLSKRIFCFSSTLGFSRVFLGANVIEKNNVR